jgi:hypothetical protein
MEKRKLVLTIIGVVILAMVIMVYIYFSKPGRDEKKNQQTINQVQTVQQKTDEKKENTEKIHPEMNWKMLRREVTNTMDQNLLKRHTSRYMSFTKNRDYRNQRLINWWYWM